MNSTSETLLVGSIGTKQPPDSARDICLLSTLLPAKSMVSHKNPQPETYFETWNLRRLLDV